MFLSARTAAVLTFWFCFPNDAVMRRTGSIYTVSDHLVYCGERSIFSILYGNLVEVIILTFIFMIGFLQGVTILLVA